jgi:hypothetical protein
VERYRLFSVEEANALLPRLTELLQEAFRHRDELRRRAPQLEPVLEQAPHNGGGRAGSEYGAEAYRLYRAISRIRELGVMLKDLDAGLIDFPHEREGRIVFLCWHPPEERVMYWHEVDAGYAGRRPLE